MEWLVYLYKRKSEMDERIQPIMADCVPGGEKKTWSQG